MNKLFRNTIERRVYAVDPTATSIHALRGTTILPPNGWDETRDESQDTRAFIDDAGWRWPGIAQFQKTTTVTAVRFTDPSLSIQQIRAWMADHGLRAADHHELITWSVAHARTNRMVVVAIGSAYRHENGVREIHSCAEILAGLGGKWMHIDLVELDGITTENRWFLMTEASAPTRAQLTDRWENPANWLELKQRNGSFADEEDDRFVGDYRKETYYERTALSDQVSMLSGVFRLSADLLDLSRASMPFAADGWFVIPKWQRVARTYGEAVVCAWDAHERTNGCLNEHRDSSCYRRRSVSECARLTGHSDGLKWFEDLRPVSDLMVMPCQYGIRHHGKSARRAEQLYAPSEFGLGLFAVLCMAITHPKRFSSPIAEHICSGDIGNGSVPFVRGHSRSSYDASQWVTGEMIPDSEVRRFAGVITAFR